MGILAYTKNQSWITYQYSWWTMFTTGAWWALIALKVMSHVMKTLSTHSLISLLSDTQQNKNFKLPLSFFFAILA